MAQEVLEVEARLKDFISGQLDKIESNMQNFATQANRAMQTTSAGANAAKAAFQTLGGIVLTTFSVSQIKRWGEESIKAYSEQVEAEALLTDALGYRSELLLDLAANTQRLTTFGDEQVLQAEAIIGNFVKEENVIARLIPLVADFATAKRMDLASAADLVTKTFVSSTNSLSRYGIAVEGAAGGSDRLASLTKGLSAAFEGQARAIAQTDPGRIKQLNNEIGDLKEVIGEDLIPLQREWLQLVASTVEEWVQLLGVGSEASEKNRLMYIQQQIAINEKWIDRMEQAKKGGFWRWWYGDDETVEKELARRKQQLEDYQREARAIVGVKLPGDAGFGDKPANTPKPPPPPPPPEETPGTMERLVGGLSLSDMADQAEKSYGRIIEAHGGYVDHIYETQKAIGAVANFENQYLTDKVQNFETAFETLEFLRDLDYVSDEDYTRLKAELVDRRIAQIERERVAEERLFQYRVQYWTQTAQQFGSLLVTMGQAAEANAEQMKALRTAETIINGAAAAISAVNTIWSSSSNQYEAAAMTAITMSLIAAETAAQVAIIQQQKFSQGGIVGGNSYSGDRITAGLNSGEMVLTRGQQAALFEMLAGGRGVDNRRASIVIDARQTINGMSSGAREIDKGALVNVLADALFEAERQGRLRDWKAMIR